jgi:predicted DNA-binding transcriptional regulator YafY
MPRGDQLGRQWKIIQSLISARKGKSVAELAQNLDCHGRTVYRDLEALQIAGFPVTTHKEDGKSYWSILEGAKQKIPIPFSLTELMALYFSRNMLRVLKHTAFYDSLESLFQKVKSTLPPAYIHYLGQIERSLDVGPRPFKSYGRFQETIDAVNTALLERRYIDISYYAMSRKAISRRRVAPYKLWFFDGTFYLIGYCHQRRDVRVFAVDRIKEWRLSQDRFRLPEDFKIEDLMRASFGVFRGQPVTVKICFSPAVAEYISEKTWHATQRIEPRPDGSILFSAQVAGTEEIKFWIMKWGSGAQVLEPESLREAIKKEAAAMLAAYGQEHN